MTEKANSPKLDVQTLEYVRDLIRKEANRYDNLSDLCEKANDFNEADKFNEKRMAMRIFERATLNSLIRKQQEAE